jgi:uncharacterized membrane protein YraQ (UPF0718 family)
MEEGAGASKKGNGSYIHVVLPGALFVVALALSFFLLGEPGVREGIGHGVADIVSIGPRILAALALAAIIQVWLPTNGLSRWLGADSGLKGLGFAGLLGSITVGGPFASFPLVATLAAAGVEQGCLVAFLTGWSLLAIQRIIVWEWPLLGGEFVFVRVIACIAMPIIAGLLMRALVSWRIS